MSSKKLIIISSEPLDLGSTDNELTVKNDNYQYNILNGELPYSPSMELCMKYIKDTIGESAPYELKKAYNELVNQLNLNNI